MSVPLGGSSGGAAAFGPRSNSPQLGRAEILDAGTWGKVAIPTPQNSTMRCPCGEVFDNHRLEHTLIHVPHITATHHGR